MISWNFLYVKLFSVFLKWLVVSKQRFFCARARTNIRSLNFQIRPGQKPAKCLSCKQHSRQLWFFLATVTSRLLEYVTTWVSHKMFRVNGLICRDVTLSMFSIKISFINNLQLKVHVFTFPRNSKLRYSLWPELFLCDKNMVIQRGSYFKTVFLWSLAVILITRKTIKKQPKTCFILASIG